MNTAVVSGANGFIGQALTKALLERGQQVVALLRPQSTWTGEHHDGLHILKMDLTQYKTGLCDSIMHYNPDIFYHFAWTGTFGKSFADYQLQLNNAIYTGDAIEAAISAGCNHFILAGTIVELETQYHLENSSCHPRISCIYGTAKLAAEMLCKILSSGHISFNSAMLASVYGVGDRSGMIQNVLLDAFNKGNSIKLVQGDNLYDWIYIDDVVRGLISIAEKGVSPKTYYVGHRNLRTFREIVTDVRDIINPNIKLSFGELPEQTPMDYSLINLDELYYDTGFEASVDFASSIQKTAQWVSSLNW